MKQNKQCNATMPSGLQNCAYRGEGSLKCAIGALIWDKHYRKSMENTDVSDPHVKKGLQKSGCPITKEALSLYCNIQEIHDQLETEDWADELEKLSKEVPA